MHSTAHLRAHQSFRAAARRTAVVVGALAMLVAVALTFSVTARAAGATATLRLAGSSGSPGERVTAIYQLTRDHCLEYSQFFWDGQLVATARIDASTCTAVVALVPPAGAAAGQHAVGAEGCHGRAFERDCDPDAAAAAVAYTVEAASATGTPFATDTPAPTPAPTTAPPTPTPAPTSRPTPPSTATPPPAPTPTATVAPGTPTPGTPAPATPTPAPTGRPTASPKPTSQPTRGPAPAPTPTPSPRQTTSPRRTAQPTPVPTASPVLTPSPSGQVLPAVGTPAPSVAPSALPAPSPTAAATSAPRRLDATVAAFVRSVPDSFVLDAKVIATNLAVTILFVLLFGLTAEVFNSTMDENRREIEGAIDRLLTGPLRFLAPVAALDASLDHLTEQGRRGAFFHGGVVLALTGLVYGFLSPDFGLNPTSLGLFVALVFGLGLLTYVDEGATTLLARRRQRLPSAVRLYGTAVAVAAVCVLISRFLDFRPGFMYGFVASAVILAPVALGRRQKAQLVVVPSILVLAISIAAWVLLTPVRGAVEADGGWLPVLLESILATVFVAGLEGLFFGLVPLHFLDGATVMRWSRAGWALLFGTVTFLWWQLIVNRDGEYADAFRGSDARVVVVALLLFMVTTGGIWLYFRVHERSEESADEPIRGGEA